MQNDFWQIPEIQAILRTVAVPTYLVGGAVRDLLLGRSVKDFDFLVDCAPRDLLDLRGPLQEATGRTVIVLDEQRGYLRVCQRGSDGDASSEGVDLAAREGDTVQADLTRRDITFNAMALSPSGEILDPFDGQEDLKKQRVKVTAPQVLEDDPLRVLRVLRIAAELSFSIEPDTLRALSDFAPGLSRVAGERIGEELFRFLANTDVWLLRAFVEANVHGAIWEDFPLPLPWLMEWIVAREDAEQFPRTEDSVLSMLAAMLVPVGEEDPDRGEELLKRIKPSRAQIRFVRQWWRGCASLRAGLPDTAREIHALGKLAGDSLPGLVQFAVLPTSELKFRPALAGRLRVALTGRGELSTDPLPLGGTELSQYWAREPGPWLKPLLDELEAAWACREVSDVVALLDHSGEWLKRQEEPKG